MISGVPFNAQAGAEETDFSRTDTQPLAKHGAIKEHRKGFATPGKEPHKMLTAAQERAADRFAKSLLTLSDDALIDTYHQASEDHREAQAEGSDNLVSAYTQMLASERAIRDRFPDYQSRYKLRYP